MEVQQLEAAQFASCGQHVYHSHNLCRAEAKFCTVSGGRTPVTCMPGGQPGSHAHHRHDTCVGGGLQQELQLAELFQYDHGVDAQLAALQSLRCQKIYQPSHPPDWTLMIRQTGSIYKQLYGVKHMACILSATKIKPVSRLSYDQ